MKRLKDFLRNICKTTGHETRNKFGKCPRCKKKLPLIAWEVCGTAVYYAKGLSKINIPK